MRFIKLKERWDFPFGVGWNTFFLLPTFIRTHYSQGAAWIIAWGYHVLIMKDIAPDQRRKK